jgi:hypothetical protein
VLLIYWLKKENSPPPHEEFIKKTFATVQKMCPEKRKLLLNLNSSSRATMTPPVEGIVSDLLNEIRLLFITG